MAKPKEREQMAEQGLKLGDGTRDNAGGQKKGPAQADKILGV